VGGFDFAQRVVMAVCLIILVGTRTACQDRASANFPRARVDRPFGTMST